MSFGDATPSGASASSGTNKYGAERDEPVTEDIGMHRRAQAVSSFLISSPICMSQMNKLHFAQNTSSTSTYRKKAAEPNVEDQGMYQTEYMCFAHAKCSLLSQFSIQRVLSSPNCINKSVTLSARSGTIRVRAHIEDNASGDVTMFLDDHRAMDAVRCTSLAGQENAHQIVLRDSSTSSPLYKGVKNSGYYTPTYRTDGHVNSPEGNGGSPPVDEHCKASLMDHCETCSCDWRAAVKNMKWAVMVFSIICTARTRNDLHIGNQCNRTWNHMCLSIRIRSISRARWVGGRRHDIIKKQKFLVKANATQLRKRCWLRNRSDLVGNSCRMYACLVTLALLNGIDYPDVASQAAYKSVLCVLMEWSRREMAEAVMTQLEIMVAISNDRVGLANRYGSEGPTAKERECIKNGNRHSLLLSSMNKNSIRSAMDYLASTAADIVFLQELNQKKKAFFKTRTSMMAGTYMNRSNGQKDARWRVEGSPSIDGLGGGNSGGTAICVRHHIGITAPRLSTGVAQDQNNLYEVVPGHLSAVVINGWARARILALSVYLDVKSKLSVKKKGFSFWQA